MRNQLTNIGYLFDNDENYDIEFQDNNFFDNNAVIPPNDQEMNSDDGLTNSAKKKKKDAIVLYTIKKSKIFYDKKNNHNKMNINGSIFNTKFDLNFLRNIENQGTDKLELSLKQISTSIKNELIRLASNKNHYKGKTSISILDYEIKTNYNIKDKLILISSDKSTENKKFINLSGKINTSPFYYDIKIDLEKINIIKLVEFFFQIKNLLQKNYKISRGILKKCKKNYKISRGFFKKCKMFYKISRGN